jgi:7,8-dihydroneopterin aldolase/epimerase/oxygenase
MSEYDEHDQFANDENEDDDGPEFGITIQINGLSLYTHHGVSDAEQEIGQRLLFDIRFDVNRTDTFVTDSIDDTIDYGEVCQSIALIAQQRPYRTLERLCAEIAERLAERYGAESISVTATKPEPPIPLPVESVSVEVWRESPIYVEIEEDDSDDEYE